MAKTRKKNKSGSKNLIMLLLVLIILGGGYYYLNVYIEDPSEVPASADKSEYTLLENTDSVKYAAIVIYNSNISINAISKTFYNSDIFWPYIFIENKNTEGVNNNPLDIPKGVVLKIPRLSENLIDAIDTMSVHKAKHLADSILNAKTAF